jgi:hypothetical protein
LEDKAVALRSLLQVLLVPIILAGFWGCDSLISELPVIDTDDVLRAKKLWKEKRLNNYDLVVRYKHGGMLPSASPVIIEVREGNAVNIRPIVGDSRPTHFYSSIDTIDKLLETIQQRVDEGVEVQGSFDPEYGYPTRVSGQFTKTNPHYYDISIDELIPRTSNL